MAFFELTNIVSVTSRYVHNILVMRRVVAPKTEKEIEPILHITEISVNNASQIRVVLGDDAYHRWFDSTLKFIVVSRCGTVSQ